MPINKATIVPRGDALGMVSYLPEKDMMNYTRQQMLAHIDVCMGGATSITEIPVQPPHDTPA